MVKREKINNSLDLSHNLSIILSIFLSIVPDRKIVKFASLILDKNSIGRIKRRIGDKEKSYVNEWGRNKRFYL